jgi:hypothetical protein
MDGRIQLPVIEYLQKRFNVEYVDLITEAAINLVLSKQEESQIIESVLDRIRISVEAHKSNSLAVVGHYDCAKNPASEEVQHKHTLDAINFIKTKFDDIEIIGLWVDKNWKVKEL